MDDSDIENFRKILNESQKVAFDSMSCQQLDIKLFFLWYDQNAPWPHGTQKDFLNCLYEIFKKDVSKIALVKQYQRFHHSDPHVKQKAMRKIFNYLDLLNYPCRCIPDGLAPGIDEKTASIVDKIFKDMYAELENLSTYHLARLGISAHGQLADGRYSLSKKNFLPSSGDARRTIRDRKHKTPFFIVLAKSQCSKIEAPSCKQFPAILKLRRELLSSGIISDNGEFYVFKQDYIFNSPSMAASVLAGININGRVYWKDESGRPLKSRREKKNEVKIRRGPGRPKKSS